jgi:tetratricopeptide (TPR) repeat protein
MPRNGSSKSKQLDAVREWSGVVFGLTGTILALLGFVQSQNASKQSHANERAIKEIEVSRLLNEAWDLMGGGPGTTLLYQFNSEPSALELAKRKISEALVLDPQNALAHRLEGVSAESFGNFNDALAAYDRSLQLDPQSGSN